MTTALEFFQSKRPSENLRVDLRDYTAPNMPGYLYLDHYWIGENSGFKGDGEQWSVWFTDVANDSYASQSLAEIEARLWKEYVEGEEA